MHVACTQENLHQGLALVSHVSGKVPNLPILGNVLLKTENGSLKLFTTNLELAVSCTVRGKVEREGEYTLPAKLFMDYVALLPAGKVELELGEEGLEIRSGEQETTMKGMAATEFPVLPTVTNREICRLPAQEVKKALQQAAFAVSTSESRPELTGVACFFGDQDGKTAVTFVATDSYRLAERTLVAPALTGEPAKLIVPSRAITELARILSSYKDDIGGEQEVVWSCTENQLMVNVGTVEVTTRLIDGSFPPYREILPKEFVTDVVIPRTELQKAVRAASLFSKQGLFDVHIAFDPTQGVCTVSSADQGTGKTQTKISCKIEGKENRVTLNSKYVSDGLSAMSTDEVKFRMIDAGNPVLILPEPFQEPYRYLVMPIRQ